MKSEPVETIIYWLGFVNKNFSPSTSNFKQAEWDVNKKYHRKVS